MKALVEDLCTVSKRVYNFLSEISFQTYGPMKIKVQVEIGKKFIYPHCRDRYFKNLAKKPDPFIRMEIRPMKLTLRRFRIKIDLSRVSNFFTLAFKMDKGKTVLKAMKAGKKNMPQDNAEEKLLLYTFR